mmetsp:Transcript_28262/g.60225  ORF Transcript_28262/g.60225 Transcript_28262/m.60225 type:complete len:561 (-) Transcript_28262:96-1778(-)
MHTSKRPTSADAARRKAFADATAGVIGSLVSMLAFYPVDVWKTSLQAGVPTNNTSSSEEDNVASTTTSSSGERHHGLTQWLLSPSVQSKLSKLFRGLPHKIVHTIVSSFTYFYVYSLVQTKYATHRRSLQLANNNSTSSTATKLLLTAFAAVINTGITLPLDTISSRKQAGTTRTSSVVSVRGNKEGEDDEKENDRTALVPSYEQLSGISNNNDADNSVSDTVSDEGFRSAHCSLSEEYHSANEEDEDRTSNESSSAMMQDNEDPNIMPRQRNVATLNHASLQKKQSLYIKSPEKYRFSFSTNLAQEAFATTTRTSTTANNSSIDDKDHLQHDNNKKQKQQQLKSILSLWNGLFPAILLCTNPAIQYTMFDTLKSALFEHRLMRENDGREDVASSTQQQQSSHKLSMWEAFLFGIISKFFATIVTYPLIRCKVMLMVSPPETFHESNKSASSNGNVGDEEKDYCCNGTVTNGPHSTMQKQQAQTSQSPTLSPPLTNKKYPRSLPLLLVHIFRKDGIRGIYKGCSLQLLHTVLKSALLMMVREKITFVSHRFFQVDSAVGS